MSETKLNLGSDLKEAVEMAEMLPTYLRTDQVYGSLSGGLFGSGSKPALTLGALLLRLRRLRALEAQLSPDQRQTLKQAEDAHAHARHEWRMHYTDKLVREAQSRLDAMRTFFEECAQHPRQCASIYLPEALRRTIIQEIVGALSADDLTSAALATKIQETDSKLRRFVRPSEFVWAKELSPAYDQHTFWWLYSRPPLAD